MSSPRVSVIIPCYNLGRFVEEAIDSALGQTFQDIEILIIDDGSTDPETQEVLSTCNRSRTRVLRTANQGLPAAKNVGIRNTTGAYLCALDADDRLAPTMLEQSVAVLDTEPSVAFVSHWLQNFGDDTSMWTPARCDFPALLDVNTVNGAALVRRSAVEAVGGFDETFRSGCEDWDFWISLTERGYAGRILPEILFHYRRRPGSMSRVMLQGEGHPSLYRRLIEKHRDTYEQHLGPLVVRREQDISSLRRHIHDLELEHHRWLSPEVEKLRDDARLLGYRDALGPVDQAEKEVAELRTDRRRLKHQLEAALVRAGQARAEADALRHSWSWKVTAPLRRAYDLLLRLQGTRRST